MNKKPASEEPGKDSPGPARPSPRDVSERAYLYYLNNESSHGHHLEHWFQAEQDLTPGHPLTLFHVNPPNWRDSSDHPVVVYHF